MCPSCAVAQLSTDYPYTGTSPALQSSCRRCFTLKVLPQAALAQRDSCTLAATVIMDPIGTGKGFVYRLTSRRRQTLTGPHPSHFTCSRPSLRNSVVHFLCSLGLMFHALPWLFWDRTLLQLCHHYRRQRHSPRWSACRLPLAASQVTGRHTCLS